MNVDDKIKEAIIDKLGVEEAQITPEASFIDDLGADSLDTVELIMALEEEFDLEIPDEEQIRKNGLLSHLQLQFQHG